MIRTRARLPGSSLEDGVHARARQRIRGSFQTSGSCGWGSGRSRSGAAGSGGAETWGSAESLLQRITAPALVQVKQILERKFAEKRIAGTTFSASDPFGGSENLIPGAETAFSVNQIRQPKLSSMKPLDIVADPGCSVADRELPSPQVDIVVPVKDEERDLAPSVRRLCSFLREQFPFTAPRRAAQDPLLHRREQRELRRRPGVLGHRQLGGVALHQGDRRRDHRL